VGLQIDDHKMQRSSCLHCLRFQQVAVEGHQHRLLPKCAALVHAPALRAGQDLTLVRQLHLASHGELQVIQAVEGAGDQDADGGAGRQPFAHGQVSLVVVNGQPAYFVMEQRLVCHTGSVAPEAAAAGSLQQSFGLHRDGVRPVVHSVWPRGAQRQGARAALDARIQPLAGAADQRIAFLQLRAAAPVAAGPV
jgi:hypothetical protein